jgi:hypothetical protein
MPLSEDQKSRLTQEAQRRGIDPAKLIAAAERGPSDSTGAQAGKGEPSVGAEKPNLYMYLLPFVTVNEVRTIWLELEAIAGGDMNAAKYAAAQTATALPVEDAS